MAKIDGIVGHMQKGIGDGAGHNLRIGKTGELIVDLAHGGYYEAASRGEVFAACSAVAGVQPQLALSGATLPFVLHNPIGSGKNLSVIRVGMSFISGTMSPGRMVLTANVGIARADPTGTAIAPKCTLLDSNTPGVAKPFSVATVGANTHVVIMSLFSTFTSSAASESPPIPCNAVLGGAVTIPPGFTMGMTIIGTGTSGRVTFAATWIESPIT